jgi:hypothetical protein
MNLCLLLVIGFRMTFARGKCRLTDRKQAAIGHYTRALTLDPFQWSAYEDLCLLGESHLKNFEVTSNSSHPSFRMCRFLDCQVIAVCFAAGAEDEAAELHGNVALANLQQQQLQNNWEMRTQTGAPAAFCVDQYDVSFAPPSPLRPSSSASAKVTKVSANTSGEESFLGGSSSAVGPGFPNVSVFPNNLTFVTPVGGTSEVGLLSASSNSLCCMFQVFWSIKVLVFFLV